VKGYLFMAMKRTLLNKMSNRIMLSIDNYCCPMKLFKLK